MKTKCIAKFFLIALIPFQSIAQNSTYPIIEFQVEKIQLLLENSQAGTTLALRLSPNPLYENKPIRENPLHEKSALPWEPPIIRDHTGKVVQGKPPVVLNKFVLDEEAVIGLIDLNGDRSSFQACIFSPPMNLKGFVDNGGSLIIFAKDWDKIAVFGREGTNAHEAAHVVQQRSGINTSRSNVKGAAAANTRINNTPASNTPSRQAAPISKMNLHSGANPTEGKMKLRNLEFRVINRAMAAQTGESIKGYLEGEIQIDLAWYPVKLDGSFVKTNE
jgi:hypothetical protein